MSDERPLSEEMLRRCESVAGAMSRREEEESILALCREVRRLKTERDDAVREEREACAKVADDYQTNWIPATDAEGYAACQIADAIRARGQ